MNPTLEISFWARLVGILALEIICVVALAFLAQSLVRSAFWRRTIWQISFVCLLLLAVAEFTGVGRGFSIWIAGKPVPERTVSVRIVPTDEQFVFPSMEYEIPEPVFVLQTEPPIARSIWWPGILWAVGLGLIAARILFARILFVVLRLRKQQIKDLVLLKRVYELAKRLGIVRRIRLLESPGLTSPVAFGIIQPSIGLPLAFAKNFNPAQQNAMLTHELAHLAARDPFWYLLADCAAALFWWHPAIWFARRRLHSASEHAADEAAAILENGPGTLAECLVNLGQQLTRRRSFGWLGVEGNGFRSHLGQRVERLLNLKEAHQPLRGWKIFFAKTSVAILFAALVVFTSGWIQNGKERREKNLSSAVQKSWSASFASTALAALAKETADGKKRNDSEVVPENPSAHKYDPLFFETLIFENVPSEQLQNVLDEIELGGAEPTLRRMFGVSWLSSNAFPKALAALLNFKEHLVAPYDFVGSKFSGMNLTYQGSPTNNENACQYFTENKDGLTVVTGAEMSYRSSNTWSFSLVPQKIVDSVQIDLVWSNAPYNLKIPVGGGVILHRVTPRSPLRSEVIVFSSRDIHHENELKATDASLNGKIDSASWEQLFGEDLFKDPNKSAKTKVEQKDGLNTFFPRLYPTFPPKSVNTSQSREQSARDALAEVQKSQASTVQREALQIPNPAARTNLVHTSKGQQAIKSKLDQIRLSKVEFEFLPLVEVLKELRDASRERDAEQVGINFLFNPHANNTNPRVVLTDDPNRAVATPIPSAPAEAPVNSEKIIVRISPALENVRLTDVLDAIVKSASQPIEYRIEAYAVIFSPKATNGLALYTHVFKINPNTFLKGLENLSSIDFEPQKQIHFIDEGFLSGNTSVSKTNLSTNVNHSIRRFFQAAGVDFGVPGEPNGKSVYFNQSKGLLMVRASLQDLELIQTAIETLNFEPAQITVEAKFVEVDEAAADSVDWNEFASATKAAISTNVDPGFVRLEAFADFSKAFPGFVLSNSISRNLTTVLSETQSRSLLKQFESVAEMDTLAAPKVTTLSGRQTQIHIREPKKIRPGPSLPEVAVEVGPTLDVIPSVSADGITLQIFVWATVKEIINEPRDVLGQDIFIPKIRVMFATANIYDGQTLVLGELTNEKGLRDKKRLFILVRAMIIDAAGNRVHSENELSFTTNSVPKQPERK